MRQQDDTKKIIHATLTYKDFLDDIDTETVDKFDLFTNKYVKYLFYKFSNYLLFRNLPTVPVMHSKTAGEEVILKEVQNRD